MDTARAIERFLNSPALGEGTRKSYRHDVDEFTAIVSHPGFSPSGARPHMFAEVGRISDGYGDASFRRLKPALDAYKARFL